MVLPCVNLNGIAVVKRTRQKELAYDVAAVTYRP